MPDSEDVWPVVGAVVAAIAMAVVAWLAWPHVWSFLTHPRPGSPQPGQECYEADWDEWGRPLWVCEPELPTWDPRDDYEPEQPPPDELWWPEA